jgi:hypothetical protein
MRPKQVLPILSNCFCYEMAVPSPWSFLPRQSPRRKANKRKGLRECSCHEDIYWASMERLLPISQSNMETSSTGDRISRQVQGVEEVRIKQVETKVKRKKTPQEGRQLTKERDSGELDIGPQCGNQLQSCDLWNCDSSLPRHHIDYWASGLFKSQLCLEHWGLISCKQSQIIGILGLYSKSSVKANNQKRTRDPQDPW